MSNTPTPDLAAFGDWLRHAISPTTAGTYLAVLHTVFRRGADPNAAEAPYACVPVSRQAHLGSAWRRWREFNGAASPTAAFAPPARPTGPSLAEREQFRAWADSRGHGREANSFLKAYETSLHMDPSTWTDRQVGARRAWGECFGRRLPLLADWPTAPLADLRRAVQGFKAPLIRRLTWGSVGELGFRNPDAPAYTLEWKHAGQHEALLKLRAFLAPASPEDPIAPWAPGRIAPMSAAVIEAVLRGES